MFHADEDGTIIYDGDTDPGAPVPDGDGSLFLAPGEASEDVPQVPVESAPVDGEAPSDAGEDSALPELTPPPVGGLTGSSNFAGQPTGSGNSVQPPSASLPEILDIEEFSVTTSGNVYIYPEISDEEPLADARSATVANVDGLPNATSLAYLEDVAAGYPSWYKYMAFKTDANYSQSMALWIAPQGVKHPSQNRLEFSGGVDCIEVRYIRSSSTSYYQYYKTHYDSYSIPYDTGVFLYTDVVDGYARLDLQPGLPLPGILLGAAVLAVVLMIFRGGAKS